MNSDNLGLQYLAYLFGSGAVYQDGSSASTFLTDINGALLNYYMAALLLVYGWTIILGVVHTAVDGEFLGRRWHSIGTPVMAVIAMLVLAPMPGYGMSVGQYVYVRGLVKGSEMADRIMKISVIATEQPRINGETIPERAAAMLLPYSLSHMCKEQLVRAGGYSQEQITGVCRTPEDLLAAGTEGDAEGITEVDREIAPKVTPCLAAAYQNMRKSEAIYLESEKVKQPAGRFEPIKVNQAAINYAFRLNAGIINPDGAVGFTPGSVSECMASAFNALPQAQQSTSASAENATLRSDVERFGWPYMAHYSDRVRQETENIAETPSFVPAMPRLDLLSNSPTDALVVSGLQGAFGTLTGAVSGSGGEGSRIEGSGGNMDSLPVGVAALGIMNVKAPTGAKELAAVKGRIDEATDKLNKANAAPGGAAANAANQHSASLGQLNGKLAKLQNLYGSQNRIVTTGSRIITAIKAKAIAGATGDAVAKGLSYLGPWGKGAAAVGTAIVGAASSATAFVLDNPFLKNLVILMALFWSNADLVPQIILAIAVILWLVRAASWFMLIPMSAVLSALPDTKVGENVWKEALGVILSPVVISMMFILGLYVYNVAFQILFDLLFGWGITDKSATEIGWIILKGLFDGSLIFKGVLLTFGMVLSYFFMAMLMLSGHDWVMGAMGLRGNNNELGQEMHSIRRHMGAGVV